MFQKSMTAGGFMLGFVLLASLAAAGVPSVVSHQGRLLGSDDKPVADGNYVLIYGLFTEPDGGGAVWTENQDITTKGGLFSVMLGSHNPLDLSLFDNDSLYLQTQVSGEAPLLPRLRLGSVPFAGKTGRIEGDIVTKPGSVKASNAAGDRVVKLTTTDLSASIAIGDPGVNGRLITNTVDDAHVSGRMSFFDVFTELSITDSIDATGARRRLAVHNLGSSGQDGVEIAARPSGGASVRCDSDSDGDGLPDLVVSSSCDNTGAQQVLYKKGLNAVNVKRAVSSRADDVEAVHWLDADSDDDGVIDRSVSSSCDATGARLAINTKGTSAKREIRASTDNETGTLTVSADLDGDGVMDNAVTDSVDAAGARRRIEVNNLGSSGQDGVSVDLRCSPDSVIESKYVKKNGTFISADYSRHTPFHNSHISSFFDVFTEMSIQDVCDATGAKHAINTKGTGGTNHKVASSTDEFSSSVVASGDLDGDGLDDSEASLRISPTTSSLAIKTKGTGAQRFSAGGDCDDTDATLHTDCDSDGDGVPENEVSQSVTPTTSGVAIKTKGTGADANRVVGATDDTSAVVLLATDDASITMKVRKGGVVNGSIIVTNTTVRMVELDSDGDGYLDHSLGIGVDATHRIDVAGGAYCDGTDWVNASDANVKENFKPVNGGELLEKIGALPISQWNYKSESAEVMHIGPTAQDFKRVFGVGSDGKSISTIDPAGIALAAIKELHMENITLKDRIADLQAQLDDLKQKAATTDDMQAQITKLSAMVEIIMGARNADEGATRMASSTLAK